MLDSVRLYLRYVVTSVRSQMQYRASFIMLSFGHFLSTGTEFLGVWALFDRFGSVRGWALPEVAVFYGMVNIAFAISEAAARGFDTFEALIKSGEFDRYLLRPRSTALQVAVREFQIMRIGRLCQGVIALVAGSLAVDVAWTPGRVALLMAAIAGGACLFSGLFVLQATMAFWTTESLEIMNTVTYGGVETAQYPLTLYREWFRHFFTFVIPLACISYFPAQAILGRADVLGSPTWFQWLSPLVGVGFLAVALRVWRFGERHYRSTGS